MNRNFCATFTTAKKYQKNSKIIIDDKVTFHYPPPLTLHPQLPTILPPDPMYLQSPTHHIRWEITINISTSPRTPNRIENKLTDAPDTYDPDAASDDSADFPNATNNDADFTYSKNSNIHE